MKQCHSLTAFLFLFCAFANAQNKIDELVNAEKSFATFSKQHSTKAAFVNFLDSNSVVFRNGAGVNGLDTWSHRKEDSSLLFWEPEFAVMSASGDFGVTSGPSVFKPSRAENERSFHGHFASVWHKNSHRQWKVLCDIGINHDCTYKANENIIKVMLPVNKNFANEAQMSVLATEQRFFNSFKQFHASLPAGMVSSKARILLQGKHPLHSSQLHKYDFTSTFSGIQFINIDHLTSPSNDLFVSYGKTKTKDKEANYLTAWINEGKGWKLILFLVN